MAVPHLAPPVYEHAYRHVHEKSDCKTHNRKLQRRFFMKKKTNCIYLLYFLCAVILLASGCDKLGGGRPEKVYGTVISVDEAKKEVVMKDASTGKQRTINAQNADQLAVLKPGMEIKARIKKGTATAEKIAPRIQKEAGKSDKQKAGEE
jgi:hypothetical protein